MASTPATSSGACWTTRYHCAGAASRPAAMAEEIAPTRARSMSMSQAEEQQAPLCRHVYGAWNESQKVRSGWVKDPIVRKAVLH